MAEPFLFSAAFPATAAALSAAMHRVSLVYKDAEMSMFTPTENAEFTKIEYSILKMTPTEAVRLFDGDEHGEADVTLERRFPTASDWAADAVNDDRFDGGQRTD